MVTLLPVSESREINVGSLSAKKLQAAAIDLLPRAQNRPVIMLGNLTCLAFRVVSEPHFRWRLASVDGVPLVFAVVPHPSHINRVWNDVDVRNRGSRFLREVARGVRESPSNFFRYAQAAAGDARPGLSGREGLMTYEETAPLLGITVDQLRHWVDRKCIPHIRLNSMTVRFRRVDLEIHVAERLVRPELVA